MSDSRLFKPLQIGNNTLQHRVVMAPLTRFRVQDHTHVPLPFVKEYYAQRASTPGTLLITEATFISKAAGGYSNAPGIWSSEQIEAWKEVTSAVHAKGSFIWLQLWAHGRAAGKDVAEAEGFTVKAPSAIPMGPGEVVPEEMSHEDIQTFIGYYAQAAKNSIEAGFDGVEIHGANGYLIDQFVRDGSNQRTDEYGGSVENRSRFALEVTKAVVDAVGADKVGIRLSPFNPYQGMSATDPVGQFGHLIKELSKFKLAYLHFVESLYNERAEDPETSDFALEAWGNTSPILLASGFTPAKAKEIVENHKDKDIAIVFGRHFLANPDLPFRISKDLALNEYNRDTFYLIGKPEGYTDYPFSQEFLNLQASQVVA
ncbi:hypothetical protein B0I35DRAFT_386493 [Stachybotrys elegans]|uniref:NADH:flavin oxidoreductase/NADH oxidase N-terminal domain-containing protein n=1 Tax=Stachybotrys elegans TaxID=80388 RepID=A0A8K0T334_9HYPO|nr:hypothetical protein B0I35DRAFT_386493 [Stachybotrys elegans]